MNAFKKSVAVAMSLLTVANICPVYSASAQNIRTNDSLINKIKRNKDDILDIAKLMVGGGLIISAGVVLGSLIDNSGKPEVSSDLASSSSNGRKAKILSTKQIDVLNDEVEFNGDLSGDAPNAALGWERNTCYFEAAMQMLYSVKAFRKAVNDGSAIKDDADEKTRKKFKILQKLFEAMAEKRIIKSEWTYAFAQSLVGHKGYFDEFENAVGRLFNNAGISDGFNYLNPDTVICSDVTSSKEDIMLTYKGDSLSDKLIIKEERYNLTAVEVYASGHYWVYKKNGETWWKMDSCNKKWAEKVSFDKVTSDASLGNKVECVNKHGVVRTQVRQKFAIYSKASN